MPKMMTDEPSVILKLKKGGHVAKKEHHKEEHGHKSMHHMMDGGIMNALASAPRGPMPPMAGMAPKRPPMAMRRKAMAAMPTPLMKKGGKTHHHAKGGEVESPKEHKAEMHEMHKIEKELKHHESMKAGKAHHGLKAGGKVHHISGHPEGSHEHHKHMAKHHAKMHKEGGSAHHKKMHEHHKHEAKMCMGGKMHKKDGGAAIDRFETKTTLKPKIDIKDKVHQAKQVKSFNTKTEGLEGKGYKHGGALKKFAKGGLATAKEYISKINDGSKMPTKKSGTGSIKEDPAGYKHGGHVAHHSKSTHEHAGHKSMHEHASKHHAHGGHVSHKEHMAHGGKAHKATGGKAKKCNW